MIRPPQTQGERDYLIQREQAGASHGEVAQELHCALETVRKHWYATQKRSTPDDLSPPGVSGRSSAWSAWITI